MNRLSLINKFIEDSKKNQNYYVCCEGSIGPMTFKRSDLKAINNYVYYNTLPDKQDEVNQNNNELIYKNIVKEIVGFGENCVVEEIQIFVVWVYYLDLLTENFGATPVFKVYLLKNVDTAFYIDVHSEWFTTWDSYIKNLQTKPFFICAPKGGVYTKVEDKIDLEFICTNFTSKESISHFKKKKIFSFAPFSVTFYSSKNCKDENVSKIYKIFQKIEDFFLRIFEQIKLNAGVLITIFIRSFIDIFSNQERRSWNDILFIFTSNVSMTDYKSEKSLKANDSFSNFAECLRLLISNPSFETSDKFLKSIKQFFDIILPVIGLADRVVYNLPLPFVYKFGLDIFLKLCKETKKNDVNRKEIKNSLTVSTCSENKLHLDTNCQKNLTVENLEPTASNATISADELKASINKLIQTCSEDQDNLDISMEDISENQHFYKNKDPVLLTKNDKSGYSFYLFPVTIVSDLIPGINNLVGKSIVVIPKSESSFEILDSSGNQIGKVEFCKNYYMGFFKIEKIITNDFFSKVFHKDFV